MSELPSTFRITSLAVTLLAVALCCLAPLTVLLSLAFLHSITLSRRHIGLQFITISKAGGL